MSLLLTMSSDMSIHEHIGELRSRIFHIIISVLIITIFSMSVGIKPYVISFEGNVDSIIDNNKNHGLKLLLFYPYPNPFDNIAIQLTSYMKEALLPPEVKLIQTAPGQAFFAQIYVSVLIGIIGSMPIIIREIFGFISPAIVVDRKHQQKKKIGIINVFLPA